MFKDKVVLVTGASRGIGKAMATAFCKENAYVIGTATSEEGATTISQVIEAAGGHGHGEVLDISNKDSISAMYERISEQMPDILINNAGITRDNIMLRMKDQEWDDVINTDLNSVFYMVKGSLKNMIKKRWGRVINLSSVVGLTGNPGQANYCAAKAGLIGFSKGLAQEIGSRNITVNTIAPGFIRTDLTKDLPEEQKQKLLNQIIMQRLGSAEDISATAIFLASQGAAYITGETINVNGGMYMQ